MSAFNIPPHLITEADQRQARAGGALDAIIESLP